VHAGLLAWVAFSPATPGDRARSLYDREIRPNEKKIVWYNLQEKVPEIGPADLADERPPRARVKAPVTMVAGPRDEPRPGALIWAPEPEAAQPKEIPLPNVVAVAPPKISRPFLEPPTPPAAPPPDVTLPDADAPRPAADDPKAVTLPPPVPKEPRRAFATPPKKKKAPPPDTALPEAPQPKVADAKPLELPEVKPRGPARAFTPPPRTRMLRQAQILLPEGPQVEIATGGKETPPAPPLVGNPATLRGPMRAFTPPPAKAKADTQVAPMAAAPEVAAGGPGAARAVRMPRTFAPTPLPAKPSSAPSIGAEPPAAGAAGGAHGGTAEATLAIVGLNPAKTTAVPAAPASRAAGFSAGPELREQGGTGGNRMALVNVPGLVVSGKPKEGATPLTGIFSPTSKENLQAAARIASPGGPATSQGPPPAQQRLSGVVAPPDPRFMGRMVYTMAIQMPNITSFSGSWLVWFAESAPEPGAARPMKAPEVVRKVDPKYIAAAAAEGIQGTVRLFGIIGRDGHITAIVPLQNLDARLDRSAIEALAKWEFTPATREGVPVSVDAIFEIPFHLAPKPQSKK
jgi:TonB family protein